jgi:hypothetical protein
MSSDHLLQKVGFERVFYLNYAGQCSSFAAEVCNLVKKIIEH